MMSIAESLYFKHIFVPDIHGPKPKVRRTIQWGEACEPIHHGYHDVELLLAAADHMLETSRGYSVPGQWGTTGPTGHLLDSSAVNMEQRSLNCGGTWQDLAERCRRLLTVGMLTGYSRAPQWRADHGIAMDKRVVLKGPFGGDLHQQRAAWERLTGLTGKRIVSLNSSHPKARKITFTGITLSPHHDAQRRWFLDFYVQYPREKYGSGWALSFLCRDDSSHPFDFSRGVSETLTQWLTRVADFVESLVVPTP